MELADYIDLWSSSTRGTWIEIGTVRLGRIGKASRPPPGGRGLKSQLERGYADNIQVVLHPGDVD